MTTNDCLGASEKIKGSNVKKEAEPKKVGFKTIIEVIIFFAGIIALIMPIDVGVKIIIAPLAICYGSFGVCDLIEKIKA